MKALLDHYGYMWMAHRPEESMFKKQGIVISTAAGAGIKSTLKDMRDSLFFWGVAKTYQFGLPVAATSYEQINDKKLKKKDLREKAGLSTKKMVGIQRMQNIGRTKDGQIKNVLGKQNKRQ